MTQAPRKTCAVCGAEFEKPTYNSWAVWEKRKCCSRTCGIEIRRGRPNPKASMALKGRKQSAQAVAARSAAMKRAHAEGRAHRIDMSGVRGEQTSQWKGDDVGYGAAHSRLRRYRGAPGTCEFCGGEAHQWALSKDAEVWKVDSKSGHAFSTRPDDYLALCRSCHVAYDRERDPATGRYV